MLILNTQKTNKGHGTFAQISSEFIDFLTELSKFGFS